MSVKTEDPIIRKLLDLGEKYEQIRAIVLSSSRCNPDAHSDIFSDYDVEIFAEDPTFFVEKDDWFHALGPVMITWRDEWGEGKSHRWMRMVVYQDGTKMDIQLGYLEDLRRISELDALPPGYDIGYSVLMDKEGVTSSMKPPTYNAYILSPPTEAEFIARIEAFWMNSTYVAKFLWRGDIIAARWMLNEMAGRAVREMLEWHVGMRNSWTWKPGSIGRGLDRALDPRIYDELILAYAGGDADALWDSLLRTTALYRRVGPEVASALGYEYPYDLDRRVTIYHKVVRDLDRNTTDREELTRRLKKSYCELTENSNQRGEIDA